MKHRLEICKQIIPIGATVAALLAFKYWLAFAPTGHWKFLLWPMKVLVELFYSTNGVFDAAKGYVFIQPAIYIDKSCAALNFGLILMASLVSYYMLREERLKKSVPFLSRNIVFSITLLLIGSYLFTLFINGMRILMLIQVQQALAQAPAFWQETAHECMGAVCFYGSIFSLLWWMERQFCGHEIRNSDKSGCLNQPSLSSQS